MRALCKLLTILFLNIACLNKLYCSFYNNQHHNFNNSNNARIKFNRNSPFITFKEACQQKRLEKTFNAINEGYKKRVESQDCTAIISSIITVATQKAQTMALHGQPFCQYAIYQYCQNEGCFINEDIINNYLRDIQNQPDNLADVLTKTYKSGLPKK